MTTTTMPSSDLRVGEKVKAALRRNYRAAARKTPPKTMAQQEQLAVSIIAALDPMGRLGLWLAHETERLQHMINHMTK